jgi:hypothetical protein
MSAVRLWDWLVWDADAVPAAIDVMARMAAIMGRMCFMSLLLS